MRYFLSFFLFFIQTSLAAPKSTDTSIITTNYNTCLSITSAKKRHYFLTELANTNKKRKQGMMHRPNIQQHEAMLFIFPAKKNLSFWMKNMQIPLDMLFFDDKGILQEIKSNVPPCSTLMCPSYPAKHDNNLYVLETKSGTAKKYKLALGNQLSMHEVSPEQCHD